MVKEIAVTGISHKIAAGIVKTKKAGKGKTVKIQVMTMDGSEKKKTIKIKIK